MQVFIFLFFTAFLTFAAEPSPPGQPIFDSSYSAALAAQDVKFQLRRFQWESTRSINNQEKCSVLGPLTEESWNRICEKAFGSSQDTEGVIYPHYISFICEKLLRSDGPSRLTAHLFWIKKNINTTQDPEVNDFLKGIDFGSKETMKIFNIKYPKESKKILDLINRSNLTPFSAEESMMIYLAYSFNKITAPNQEKEMASLISSVRGGVPAASYELGLAIQYGRANYDDEQAFITPKDRFLRAARLFRKAIQQGSMSGNTALAILLELHPEVALLNEKADQFYRAGIQDGHPNAANNYAISLEAGAAHTDEYKQTPPNLNELIARLFRQSIRGGEKNGFDGLGKMIADGSTDKNKYGETFPEDQRQENAMRMIATAIKRETDMSLYNYAFFVENGRFTHDPNGKKITDKNNTACRLYQKAAKNGNKLSLNSLALKIHSGEFKKNEDGKDIPDSQRTKESLRMLEKADYPDAWFNYASIASAEPETLNLSDAEKISLYDKICQKIQSLPDSTEKNFLLCRLALHLNPSEFPTLINRLIESGNMDAFYLLLQEKAINETKNKTELAPPATAAEPPSSTNKCLTSSDDDTSLDFQGNTEEDLLKTSDAPELEAAEDTPAVQASTIKSLQPKEPLSPTQTANDESVKALKRTLKQRVDAHTERARKGNFFKKEDKDAEKNITRITWSPLARKQLMNLPQEQRNDRLPLLIEAAKDFPKCSSLIERLKHRKTTDGKNIYSGRLTQEDRLEFTVDYSPTRGVSSIHIISLKGHYTS